MQIGFPPATWDMLPDILELTTLGIVVNEEFMYEDGRVQRIDLRDDGKVWPSVYLVHEVHRGLINLVPNLHELKKNWNPKGILTYLTQILEAF